MCVLHRQVSVGARRAQRGHTHVLIILGPLLRYECQITSSVLSSSRPGQPLAPAAQAARPCAVTGAATGLRSHRRWLGSPASVATMEDAAGEEAGPPRCQVRRARLSIGSSLLPPPSCPNRPPVGYMQRSSRAGRGCRHFTRWGPTFNGSRHRPDRAHRSHRAAAARFPASQVDGCGAELCSSREYFQRQKICGEPSGWLVCTPLGTAGAGGTPSQGCAATLAASLPPGPPTLLQRSTPRQTWLALPARSTGFASRCAPAAVREKGCCSVLVPVCSSDCRGS